MTGSSSGSYPELLCILWTNVSMAPFVTKEIWLRGCFLQQPQIIPAGLRIQGSMSGRVPSGLSPKSVSPELPYNFPAGDRHQATDFSTLPIAKPNSKRKKQFVGLVRSVLLKTMFPQDRSFKIWGMASMASILIAWDWGMRTDDSIGTPCLASRTFSAVKKFPVATIA